MRLLKLVDRLTDEERAFAARVMDECGVSRYQLAVSLKKRQKPARRISVLVNRIETLRQSFLKSKKASL